MTTILVIEDNHSILENLVETLDYAGYTVLAARNGEEGLTLAQANNPSIILSDIIMPKLDGFAMLEALRADPATAQIPVVFTTARADPESKKKGMALGVNHYIVKPFYTDDLLKTVKQALEEASS